MASKGKRSSALTQLTFRKARMKRKSPVKTTVWSWSETHTAGHQAVYVSDQDQTVVFTGDFLFMRAFLKVNWVSALDLFPFEAMERKAAFLKEAAKERYLLWFYHETEQMLGYWTGEGFEPAS